MPCPVSEKPPSVPSGVTVEAKGQTLSVKGPRATCPSRSVPRSVWSWRRKEALVELTGAGPARQARAYHGMTRALLNNMVEGVSKGFQRNLEIVGVGWNAKAGDKKLTLNIGFCHPVDIDMPEGVTVQTPAPTKIQLAGPDKQAVGQIAAVIRKVRPPEPYKGKGIRYEGEFVRRKSGKSFGS
ncbi:MAG: 50S ribosomal protein L6 [Planctomycetota bacterium]